MLFRFGHVENVVERYHGNLSCDGLIAVVVMFHCRLIILGGIRKEKIHKGFTDLRISWSTFEGCYSNNYLIRLTCSWSISDKDLMSVYILYVSFMFACRLWREVMRLSHCSWYLCRDTESLGLGEFPTGDRLEWHGVSPHTPDWTESSKFVAFTLVIFPYSYYTPIIRRR